MINQWGPYIEYHSYLSDPTDVMWSSMLPFELIYIWTWTTRDSDPKRRYHSLYSVFLHSVQYRHCFVEVVEWVVCVFPIMNTGQVLLS